MNNAKAYNENCKRPPLVNASFPTYTPQTSPNFFLEKTPQHKPKINYFYPLVELCKKQELKQD
ncbi:MAG: hypothetical protein DSY76_03290 [Bacteroidetes bacterium]|nr:MAG: hypothetical protein DSY76_03290 [Bacteroidota bacterium]